MTPEIFSIDPPHGIASMPQMQPILYLPPAAALAIVGLWLGSQYRSITTLEKETLLLRAHIAAAGRSNFPEADPSLAAKNGRKGAGVPDAINWERLAAAMAKGEGISESQGMKLFKSFDAMSGPELRAALAKIAALGLRKKDREELENWIIEPLAQKDPQLMLEHFIDRINDSQSSLSWQLPNTFQQWASKEPAAAAAWFDREIEAGKFESRSLKGDIGNRLEFEARLLPALLSISPDAVNLRLKRGQVS